MKKKAKSYSAEEKAKIAIEGVYQKLCVSRLSAILDGERDTIKLANLKDAKIKNDIDVIAKSLEGDYRKEHLFTLKQELDAYEFYQQKIRDCDKEIEDCYQQFDNKGDGTSLKKTSKRAGSNVPEFNLKQRLYDMTGIDFTNIPGFEVLTVQTIISEVGLDMNKWPTEKHFASWLGLSPGNKITGGKVLSTKTRKVVNRASEALRISAHNIGKSKTALGAYYRRIKQRVGSPKAITATARKLACMFYRLMKYGRSYVEKGVDYYEKLYEERVVKNLEKTAKKLGFILVKQNAEA